MAKTVTPAGTGFDAGDYALITVFEWTDRQGNRHQSRPSTPLTFTLAANDTISVTVPMLRLTRKSNVMVVVYMTEANGTLYYRVPFSRTGFEDTLGIPNSTTVDTVTSAVTYFATADIQQGELLYTTGGILPNGAYPACKHVTVAQERLFMVASADNQVRYTDAMTAGFFPATNEIYTFETDSGAGRLSAVEALDDKVIVLQEQRLSAIVGRGPNRLGLDNQFSPITPIAAKAGHSWFSSDCVVADPDGIWFRDVMGLRHLNRGLQLSLNESGGFLGEEVDESVRTDFGQAPAYPRSGIYYRDQNQVRFCNGPNSGVLVFDVSNKQWSIYTSAGLSGAIQFYDQVVLPAASGLHVMEGAVCVVMDADGQLYYESALSNQDQPVGRSTLQVVTTVTTAWLKLANLQGYQRVYRALVLGELGGSGASYASGGATLQIAPSFNYNNDTVAGTSPTFSSWASAATGSSRRFQVEHQLVTQKCESVQFVITYTSTTSSTGWAKLTGLTLQVGLKKGTFKNSASRRF